jgi:hypothetical protein
MVEKFEVGKWYKYFGDKPIHGWNSQGLMDGVLDGKPHKCIMTNGSDEANFEVTSNSLYGCWNWRQRIENWHEVPAPKYTTVPLISGKPKRSKITRRAHVLASLKIE